MQPGETVSQANQLYHKMTPIAGATLDTGVRFRTMEIIILETTAAAICFAAFALIFRDAIKARTKAEFAARVRDVRDLLAHIRARRDRALG